MTSALIPFRQRGEAIDVPACTLIWFVAFVLLVGCGERSPGTSRGHHRVYEFTRGAYKATGFVGVKSLGMEVAYSEHTNYLDRQVKFFVAASERDPSSEAAKKLLERFEMERDVARAMGTSARFGWMQSFPHVSQGKHAAVMAGRDESDAYDFCLLLRWPDSLNWPPETNITFSILDELAAGIREDAPALTNLSPIVTSDGKGFVPEVGRGLGSAGFLQQR